MLVQTGSLDDVAYAALSAALRTNYYGNDGIGDTNNCLFGAVAGAAR